MQKIFSFAEIGEIQDNRSKVQILRTWKFKHPQYWEFEITKKDLAEFKANYDAKKRGVDLAVDENHDGNHKAVGWYKEVLQEWDKLFAVIEWTKEGLKLLKEKVYRYFSPELYFDFQDEESGEIIKNLLIGWGITNRPFFKNMEALAACEPENTTKVNYFLNTENMKSFKELNEALSSKDKLSFSELSEVRLAFSELSEGDQNVFSTDFKNLENKFSEEEQTQAWEEGGENNGNWDQNNGTQENGEDKGMEGEGNESWEDKGNEEGAGEGQGQEGWDKAFSWVDVNSKEFSEMLKSAVGLDIEGVKNLQKTFWEMAAKAKKEEIEKKVNWLVFNEGTKTWFIKPAWKDAITNFVSKLNDNLVAEFFEILPKAVKSINFNEIGKEGNQTAKSFSVPTTTPAWMSRESFVLNEVAKQYSEQNKVSLEDGLLKAEKIVKEQGIK